MWRRQSRTGAAWAGRLRRRGKGRALLVAMLVACLCGTAAAIVWFHRGRGEKPYAAEPQPPRPAPRPGGFVGSEACTECHEGVAQEYAAHPMAQSSIEVDDGPAVEDYANQTEFTPIPSRRYRVEKRTDGVYHHELGLDALGEVIYDQAVRVRYAIGSGRRGRSYVIDRDGLLFQSPISWYAKAQRWDLSPGYQPARHARFDRVITDRCLHCHTGQVNYDDRSATSLSRHYREPPLLELGIGCERCHGPGEQHIRYQRGGKDPSQPDPIVNPARLSPSRRDSACNQCHMQGEHEILRYGRSHEDFRPGDHVGEIWSIFLRGTGVRADLGTKAVSHVEQMQSSVCYQQSNAQLGCISCHDSHSVPAAEQEAAYYRERCLACHGDRGCSLPEPERSAQEDSCIACHMPRLQATDVPHTTQTDHRVMRSAQQTPAASGSQAGSAPRIFGAGEVPLEPWEQQRAMALMLAEEAQWKSDARLAATAEPELQAVATKLPDDVLLLDALALVNVMLGRGEQATRHWKRALALEPHQQDVLYALAAHYQKSGELAQSREYLERFLAQNKSRADMFGRYSFLLAQQGEVDRAIEVALQGLELDPTLARLYEWLSQLYDNQGKTAEAEKYRAVLRRLAPPPGSGGGE